MPYAGGRPRLWYERSGDGEPCLLITGFTISAAIFDPVLALYEPHFECIRYDNRGSGRSGSPVALTSMPQLAHDAVRLLDALGIDSAHIYGVSMGGMIAQELAIRFPERVRGLVLGATSPGGPRAARPKLASVVGLGAAALGALRQPGRPWLAPMVFSPEFRAQYPERTRELLTYFAANRARPWGMAAHWWASVYHDTVSRLGKIQAPTLVIHGARDAMSPLANARMLAERIPDAELAIVPDAGHAYALERPQESFDLLKRWIGERGPIPAGRPNRGWRAQLEPVDRALGLQVGALRTGGSLLVRGAELVSGERQKKSVETIEGGRNVAIDRRAT